MYEGGIRVPFALRWKGRLPGRTVYGWPVISLDLFATAAGAADFPPGRARRKHRPGAENNGQKLDCESTSHWLPIHS